MEYYNVGDLVKITRGERVRIGRVVRAGVGRQTVEGWYAHSSVNDSVEVLERAVPQLPEEPGQNGTVIKLPNRIPAFRVAANRWSFTNTPSVSYTWSELLGRSGNHDFEILWPAN